MLNRLVQEASDFSAPATSQWPAWMLSAHGTIRTCVTAARRLLMVLGIIAIGAIAVMFFKPEVADHLKALSPFTETQASNALENDSGMSLLPASPSAQVKVAVATVVTESPEMAESRRQRERITNWISRRYRVASDATTMLVSAVYQTADELKLDPLLVLSVMAIESRFNPFAESPVGAQGLMQVMSKVHSEKFEDHGGVKAALNPVANIKVGSRILKDYVRRGGSVEAGLKLYVGAGAMDTDFGYGAKVLAEYARLKDVAMGKKVSIYATTARRPAAPKTESAPAETVASEPSEPDTEVEKIAAL